MKKLWFLKYLLTLPLIFITTAVRADTVAESYEGSTTTNPAADWATGTFSSNQYKSSQSFQLSSAITCTAVALEAFTNFGSPTGDVTFRIETDSAGDPSGTLVDANATKTQAWTVSAWNKATFANTFSLSASTTYHIVLTTVAQGGDHYYRVENDQTGYANGTNKRHNGTSWSNLSVDANFRVYQLDSGVTSGGVSGPSPMLIKLQPTSLKKQEAA